MIKFMKRIMALLIALSFCVTSFAAVVSSDDGTAFVTKSEFESMKENFSEQVIQYNNSLDGKIDGAIAAYINGINLADQPKNLWYKIMTNANDKILWCSANLPESYDRTRLQDEIKATVLRYYNHPEYNTYTAVRGHGDYSSSQGTIYQVAQTKAHAEAIEGGNDQGICRSYNRNANSPLSSNTGWVDKPFLNLNEFQENALTNSFVTTKQIVEGKGKLFRLNKLPNDNFELKYYYEEAFFKDNLDIKCYSYKNAQNKSSFNGWAQYYTYAGGMNDTTTFDLVFPEGTGYTGGKIGDTSVINYNATSSWSYGIQTLGWTTKSDKIDYSFRFWGTNVDQDLYAITDDVKPNWSAATEKTDYGTGSSLSDKYTYLRDYYPYTGPATEDVEVSNIQYKFKHPEIKQAEFKLNAIQNSYISTVAADKVYHGNGAPAFRVYVSDLKYKVKDIKIELYDKDSNLTSGTVRIMFSNNKFNKGDFATTTDKLYDETLTVPASGKLTVNTDAFDLEENTETVWVNVYPTEVSAGKLVKLVSIDPSVA